MRIQLAGINVPSSSGRYVEEFTSSDLQALRDSHGDENAYNCALLIESWVALLADSSSYCGLKPNWVYRKFRRALCLDLLGEIRKLSDLADGLISHLRHTDEGTSIGPFSHGFLKTPIAKEYIEFTRKPKASSLQFLLSFCYFGKKLYYIDETLESDALRKWLEVEERVSSLTMPDWAPILRHVVGKALESFEHVPLPAHGGGRVAEQGIKTVAEKSLSLKYDPRIERLFGYPYANASYLPMGGSWSRGVMDDPSVRRARLRFVPKTYKSRRSICMESATCMWAQQSVRRALEESISNGFLRWHVRIDDQTKNQEGSLWGSLTGFVDTIDLSSASDSISWALVKKVFPARISKYLSGTRTTEIELPDGSIFKQAKFAPMGSAVCFPTQSILFASVVLLAHAVYIYNVDVGDLTSTMVDRVIKNLARTYHTELGLLQPFRVYGDDIICDSRVTAIVVRLLRRLAFEVNESKSFVGDSAFRESCGTFHFDGKDVSPIFFKVGLQTSCDGNLARLSNLIDLCNLSRKRGYYRLSTYLQKTVLTLPIKDRSFQKKNGKNPILFSDRVLPLAIWTASPQNNHLRCRRFIPGLEQATPLKGSHQQYQRDEYKSIGVSQDVVEVDGLDNYNYLVWQRSRRHRTENSDGITSDVHASNVLTARLRWRWTPA